MTQQPEPKFTLPNYWQVNRPQQCVLEVERVLSKNGHYHALKFTFKKDKNKITELAATIEEQVAIYLLCMKVATGRVSPKSKTGIPLVRQNKSIVIDKPEAPHARGLVLIAKSVSTSCTISINPKECVILSGILLSNIALNLGVSSDSAQQIISQWGQL